MVKAAKLVSWFAGLVVAGLAVLTAEGADGDAGQGYSLVFHGIQSIAGLVNGAIDFGDTGMQDVSTDITISMWVKWRPFSEGGSLARWSSNPDGSALVFMQSLGTQLQGVTYYMQLWYTDSPNPQFGEWFHLAFVKEGANVRHYVNSQALPQAQVDPSFPLLSEIGTSLTLGGFLYTDGDVSSVVQANLRNAFRGEIDDFSVWSRALTAAEVSDVYTNPIDVTESLPSDLILHYNFDAGNCASPTSTDGLLHSSCGVSGDGEITNYGSAGTQYNLLRGRLTNKNGFGDKYLGHTNTDGTPVDFDVPGLGISGAGGRPATVGNGPWVYIRDSTDESITIQLDSKLGTVESVTVDQIGNLAGGSLRRGSNDAALSNGDDITAETSLSFTGNVPTAPVWVRLAVVPAPGAPSKSQEIHVWPPSAPSISASSGEWETFGTNRVRLPLGQYLTTADGRPADMEIVSVPSTGLLTAERLEWTSTSSFAYVATANITAGNTVLPFEDGHFVSYAPPPVTEPLTVTFSVRFVSRANQLYASAPMTVSIKVLPIDEVPTVRDQVVEVTEDSVEGVDIEVKAFDFELTFGMNVLLTELPKKGDLYLVQGSGEPPMKIEQPANIYDAGAVKELYVEKVRAVSSFDVSPTSISYHPMLVIGPPDCLTKGLEDIAECPDYRLDDPSFEPFIGQRVLFNRYNGNPLVPELSVPGKIVKIYESETGEARYEAEMLYTQRFVNGKYEPCIIESDTGSWSYPDNCMLTNVTPERRLVTNLTRADLSLPYGAWTPKERAYVGDLELEGGEGSGTYGDEYVFKHNQADTYLTEGYTEYIEVEFAEALYPVAFEAGANRGGGSLVSIKALIPCEACGDDEDHWQLMYKGQAQKEKYAETNGKGFYFQFDEDICRPSFKANVFRFEFDTSAETGIADYNYLDYIKFVGGTELAPAMLRTTGLDGATNNKIRYIPHPEAYGQDIFQLAAFDCGGDRLRSSEPGTITIEILPQKDDPIGYTIPSEPSIVCGTDESDDIELVFVAEQLDGEEISLSLLDDEDIAEVVSRGSPYYVEESGRTLVNMTIAFKANCDPALDSAPDRKQHVRFELKDGAGSTVVVDAEILVIKEDKNYISPVTLITTYSMFGFNALACVLSLLWIFVYRESAVVRAAQVPFLALIVFGAFISSLAIIFITVDDSISQEFADFSCMATVWLYSIGFMITTAALYAKLYRIERLFDLDFGHRMAFGDKESRERYKNRVSQSTLSRHIAAWVAGDVVICLVWTFYQPLKFERTVTSTWNKGEPIESYGMCDSELSLVFVSIFIVYHLVALFRLARMSYVCTEKKISGAFSEAKYIRFSVFGATQLFLLSIPLMFVVSDPESTVFLRSGLVFLNDASILAFLMVPKVYFSIFGLSNDGLGAEIIIANSGSGSGSGSKGTRKAQARPSFTQNPSYFHTVGVDSTADPHSFDL